MYHIMPSHSKPSLYIVSVPIGNMEDITLRALRLLKSVELIACEDTRVTDKLLQHHGIKGRMIAYHDHSGERERERIFAAIHEGKSVALVSDAGTPMIADPGYKLVREAYKQGIEVIAIPGACAAITALTIAGLPTDRFFFEGFLPPKTAARTKRLEALRLLETTLVCYESPKRLCDTLVDIAFVFGENHEVCVARELTKSFEEYRTEPVSEVKAYYAAHPDKQRGEIVVVIAPLEGGGKKDEAALRAMLSEALSRMSLKDAVADVTAKSGGWGKKEVYQLALEVRG
jgi:16S rRNA (cytidine1402-2'-O)-methyltransferase